MTSTTLPQERTAEKVYQLSPEARIALRNRRIRRGCAYALAIAIAIWILMPMWLIATLAFSPGEDVLSYPRKFAPIPFSTDTMEFFLVDVQGTWEATVNSVIVAVMTLIMSTIIATPAGYAISRYVFRGRDAVRLGVLAVRAFPIVILAIPLATNFIRWGIHDTVYGVALMHTALALPTTILVISSVFASVPYEFEEAAKVFGASPLQAFFRVILPLVLPGIAAAAIFTFVMSWNEVFAASILTSSDARTLPAEILNGLTAGSSARFKFAGGFFMLVPSLIFIFLIRRYLFNMWGQITK
ncbi:MAG: carbohydrate ABC transporter permease [Chloroflexi bacterium]|nr:carbohydrate ABC transporter permease [Chloroflexota bacterium]